MKKKYSVDVRKSFSHRLAFDDRGREKNREIKHSTYMCIYTERDIS